MNWKWPNWKGALEKYRYVLIVMAAGAVLLLLPSGRAERAGQEEAAAAGTEECFELEDFEEKLSRTLSQVDGAGETRVVLTVDSGSRRVLAQDQQRDSGGGLSSTVVTLGRGSGSQEVVALQTVAPDFRGALVVCQGGGAPQVRLRLIQAVSALTGLGADRISVCAGNP